MNRYKNILILLFIQVLLYYCTSFAQGDILKKTITQNQSIKIYPPGITVISVVKDDSVLETKVFDPNEEVKVIVQFKGSPLSLITTKQKSFISRLASAQSKIEYEHLSFKNELSLIENQGISQPNSIYKKVNTQIRFEYKVAINGMAITTKRWVVEEIKKLSYVKSVYEDKEVKAYDETSNHVIGADSVWIKLGLTGKGIKIGIIDTGIDYLHPDLGGGIGPNFKVFGGYDFVNNDNDPMDDNGHGTHVAGIVSANGDSLKGVAPDSKLYAFKVLDKNGSGQNSTIIAGIERALDPDNNPNTNDAVNIISMSLGGPGDPDDPMSQAIDNATAAGVICVIAAGNSGSAYQTIGSPGCARTAITVGASDNNDNIADFSSRGPSDKIYEMKPDIVAPGVSINSDKMGGGYISLSGTSMATPAVAGCAALLLQLHSNWTPLMIKSDLMETAKDIGQDLWTQGSGRIDIYKAAKQNSFISPASLSFGVIDLSQLTYSVLDTLWVYNFSSTQKTYNFSLSQNLPTGFNIKIEPTNITINSNEYSRVIVSAIINNNILPFTNSNPPAYTGEIIATSNNDSYKIPFAIIKSPVLDITFDEEPAVVLIHNRKDRLDFISWPGTNLSVLLPQDTYDILILYPDGQTLVIREGVTINTINKLEIKKSEAKNNIHLLTVDENGNNVYSDLGSELIIHKDSKIGLITSGGFHTEKYFSDFSDNYFWEWQARSHEYLKKFYGYNGYLLNGCKTDITQKNDPSNFKHIIYNYNFESDIKSVYPVNSIDGSYFIPFNDPPLTYPFIQEAFLTPRSYPDFATGYNGYSPISFNLIFEYKGSPFGSFNELLLLKTPNLIITSKDTAEVWFWGDLSPTDKFTGKNFNAKRGAPHWYGKLRNTETTMNFTDARGFQMIFFYYPMEDWSPIYELPYELYQNLALIDSGEIKYGQDFPQNKFSIPISSNQYTLKISTSNYYIQEKQGNALVQLTFDTRKTDKNPPVLTSLKIFAGNGITDIIKPTDLGSVSFSVEDESLLSNVILFIQTQGSNNWDTLRTNKSDNTYTANIPKKLAEGFVSLKILAEDASNNKLEYEVDPAFYSGESPVTDIKTPSIENDQKPAIFSLKQNYPNPFNPNTTINFSIPKTEFVTLKLYDVLSREVEILVNEQKNPGDYKIAFNAGKLASGVYFYQLRSSDYTSIKKMLLLK